jgi:hypothetical protein
MLDRELDIESNERELDDFFVSFVEYVSSVNTGSARALLKSTMVSYWGHVPTTTMKRVEIQQRRCPRELPEWTNLEWVC